MPKPGEKVNVSSMAGRTYIASSGNQCDVELVQHGLLRTMWENPPTDDDLDEFAQWSLLFMGHNPGTIRVEKVKAPEAKNDADAIAILKAREVGPN